MIPPFFYTDPLPSSATTVVLNEENSKHIVQVLRMQMGEQLRLTDGLGNIYTAEITDAHKKKCTVRITESNTIKKADKKVCIAVSPVKNNGRFEWFLEKATEIGVTEIVPLLCTRTEKQHFRYDRMQGILISAMLQSQQAWLPLLHQPVKFGDYINSLNDDSGRKYIAHCDTGIKTSLKETVFKTSSDNSTILIGPEGDFTNGEIAIAIQNEFLPVSLGSTRLRTETAALVGATILCVS